MQPSRMNIQTAEIKKCLLSAVVLKPGCRFTIPKHTDVIQICSYNETCG